MMTTPTIASWAGYIEAIDRLASEALGQLGLEEITLAEFDASQSLGPCPPELAPMAHRAAFQLHEVIVAFEQRQSMLTTELHRRPRQAHAEPDAQLFDFSM
jgi:hypothetical protein